MEKQEAIEKYKDLILMYGEVFIPEYGILTKNDLKDFKTNKLVVKNEIVKGDDNIG